MSEEKRKGGFFSRWFKKDKPQEEEPAQYVEQAPPAAPPPTPEEAEQYDKLKTGLRKTRKGFLQSLDEVFLGRKELDEQMIVQLEESLVKADIGVKTAYELLDTVTDRVRRKELTDPAAVIARLEELTTEMLTEVEAPLRVGYGTEPFVIMVIGVNGSGKTTTIAKIAARHRAAGRKVLLAAGDTFRAAAVEQLTIWANRIGCDVVRGKEKADPSSVAFEAMEKAIKEDYEVLLVDTAGRLHTRVPLMDELKKVKRTLGKKLSSSPHETLLVIDASMGQNAILQARMFNEAIPITGIALTKLDGTSKGGVVVGISNELKIPIRFIGIGEQMDDLRDFNARAFAAALFTDVEVSEETEEP